MMAMTKDFSGEYDYEREEARILSNEFIEAIEDGSFDRDSLHSALIKERAYWSRFDDFDMKSFADEFNSRVAPVSEARFGVAVYL